MPAGFETRSGDYGPVLICRWDLKYGFCLYLMISRKISSCLVELIVTCGQIVNCHTASFEFVDSIPLFDLISSSSLPSEWSLIWMGFNLSKEWLGSDVNGCRRARKLKHERKALREAKGDLRESWAPKRILRIGIQLQTIPAHISAVLQSFRIDRVSRCSRTYHKVKSKAIYHSKSSE
jgi:hypothetical protein